MPLKFKEINVNIIAKFRHALNRIDELLSGRLGKSKNVQICHSMECVCLWLLLFLLFLIKQHNIYFTPYAHSLNDRQLKPEKALTQTKVDNNQQQAVRAAETNVSQYPMFQKQLEIKRMVDSFGVGKLLNF